MAVTPYQTAFLQLLPSGLAWNKSPDSKLSALAQAISDVIATAADDARQMLRERFPSTSRWYLGGVGIISGVAGLYQRKRHLVRTPAGCRE
ncbi:Uncharacterized protein conserved in bacteria (DUF2313) [Salmonella enterica subsp. enterica]|nr:Uncharacterized protein conserved in bacteria (DUF2313) [Salmonella enterica subsp. enterica]